ELPVRPQRGNLRAALRAAVELAHLSRLQRRRLPCRLAPRAAQGEPGGGGGQDQGDPGGAEGEDSHAAGPLVGSLRASRLGGRPSPKRDESRPSRGSGCPVRTQAGFSVGSLRPSWAAIAQNGRSPGSRWAAAAQIGRTQGSHGAMAAQNGRGRVLGGQPLPGEKLASGEKGERRRFLRG